MATLVPEDHPALHTIADEVTNTDFQDGTVTKLIKDLKNALQKYSVEGFTPVAIAAPQIGVSKRIFIVMPPEDSDLPELVAVNPRIIKSSKKTKLMGEGCLSLPELYGEVYRHTNVTLRALNENGEEYERGAGDLLAQIFQHETDHLDGMLFTDRAERFWKIEAEENLV